VRGLKRFDRHYKFVDEGSALWNVSLLTEHSKDLERVLAAACYGQLQQQLGSSFPPVAIF
jgi:hypothetical protein